MNQQLKDAYEQLNNMHPDLFKGCPAEVAGVEVKKNRTARNFDACTDAGLCFEDEYFEREPSSLTADASEVEQESNEGSTIYLHGGYATLEDIERVANKIRSHYVRYDDTRKTEGERAFNRSQASSSCQVEPGLTGTGSPELNVQPFDGYKDSVPLRSLNVYVEDRCATQWVDGDSSTRHIPHYINCWLSTCAPGPNSVTEHLDNGLQEQLDTFGRKIFLPIKNASSPKKFQAKEKALVNALWRAFGPRQKYASDSTLSLDTCPIEGKEAAWTPITESPMDVMLYEERQERRARRARHELVKVRDHLGGDKWVLLMESLQKTAVQIAEEINGNGGDTNAAAIRRRLKRVRDRLASLKCHV
jgi:hypothetical protein